MFLSDLLSECQWPDDQCQAKTVLGPFYDHIVLGFNNHNIDDFLLIVNHKLAWYTTLVLKQVLLS